MPDIEKFDLNPSDPGIFMIYLFCAHGLPGAFYC